MIRKVFQKIFRSEESKKVLFNFNWVFSDRVLRTLLGALIGLLIARYLKPELFGVYSYILVFGSFFNIFAGLGIHKILVRELSKDNGGSEKLIQCGFSLMLIAGLICFVLCPTLLFILRPGDHLSFVLVLIYSISFIFSSLKVLAYYFESQTKMKPVVIAGNTAFIIGFLIKVFGLTQNDPIFWFIIGTTLDVILSSVLLLFVYKKIGYRLKFILDIIEFKKLLKDSLPLILTAVSVKIYSDIDQIMIRELVSDHETGYYAAAVRIANLWLFLPSAIFVSIFPSIVNLREKDKTKYKKMLQRLFNIASFISYCAAVFFTLFSSYIILFCFGIEYEESALYLKFLVWSGIFSALGGARTLFLLSENLTTIYFLSTFIACILNVVLNLVLIPDHGALGACLATFISYFVAGVGSSFVFKSSRTIGWMQLRSLIYPAFWNS